MKAMYAESRRAAPLGAYSSVALLFVAVSSLAFRLSVDTVSGRVFVFPFVIAYLVFCPALASCVYSLLFEARKRFAAIGLAFAFLAGLSFPILLDSVLLLPFAFLAVMGIVKFFRWRTEKKQSHLPTTAS